MGAGWSRRRVVRGAAALGVACVFAAWLLLHRDGESGGSGASGYSAPAGTASGEGPRGARETGDAAATAPGSGGGADAGRGGSVPAIGPAGVGDLLASVLDAEGNPAPGVAVSVYGGSARRLPFPVARWLGRETAEPDPLALAGPEPDGFVRIRGLPAGRVLVVASGAGFVRQERAGVEIVAGEETWIEIRLRRGMSISGRVTDEAGSPIAGAEIQAVGAGFGALSMPESARSGADGEYDIAGLQAGSFDIIVRADGYAYGHTGAVRAGSTGIDFELAQTGSIAGRVVWRGTATPVPRAVVRTIGDDEELPIAWMFGPTAEGTATTGADGGFAITGVVSGGHVLQADAAGLAPGRSGRIFVEKGRAVRGVVVELAPGTTVSGVVLREGDRRPVAGAVVVVVDDAASPAARMAEMMDSMLDRPPPPADGESAAATDRMGRFTLANVAPGSRILGARLAPSPGTTATVTVPESGALEGVEMLLPSGGAIAGTVWGADGEPFAGFATVVAQGPHGSRGSGMGLADETGRYRISGVVPGEYDVAVIATDEAGTGAAFSGGAGGASVEVREGETSILDLRLGGGTRVHGTVRRGRDPVPEVQILFFPQDAGDALGGFAMAESSGDGTYSVPGMRPGSYSVRVAGAAIEAAIPDVPEYALEIALPPGSILGRVVDAATGKPVPETWISALRTDGAEEGAPGGFGHAQSAHDGAFRLDGLEAGSYDLSVSAESYAPWSQRVELESAGSEPFVEVRLDAGVSIRGTVADPSGRPVAGALIDVRPLSGPPRFGGRSNRVSGEDGRFEVGGVLPGTFTVVASARGFAPSSPQTLEATARGADVDLRLRRGGRLHVRVVDASGSPVGSMWLAVVDPAGLPVTAPPASGGLAESDGRGEYVVENVAPGPCVVRAYGLEGRTGEVSAEVREGQTTEVTLTAVRR